MQTLCLSVLLLFALAFLPFGLFMLTLWRFGTLLPHDLRHRFDKERRKHRRKCNRFPLFFKSRLSLFNHHYHFEAIPHYMDYLCSPPQQSLIHSHN